MPQECYLEPRLYQQYPRMPSFICPLYHRGSPISGQLSTPYVYQNRGPETKCRLIIMKQQSKHESLSSILSNEGPIICILKQFI